MSAHSPAFEFMGHLLLDIESLVGTHARQEAGEAEVERQGEVTSERTNPLWRWFWGTALVLTCLLSVALYKAAQPAPRPGGPGHRLWDESLRARFEYRRVIFCDLEPFASFDR
jgi:hypothetical protein